MTEPVVSARGLSKAYRLGSAAERPDTIAGALASWLRSPLRRFRDLRRLGRVDPGSDEADVLWALRDVTFDVADGDVLGIVGSNGAGKSTLLKILSGITPPTSGQAVLRGRVGSLLEVGTGFHPELTGRDNVYMNGTLLGMTKRDVDRRYEEIVEFAGVQRFMETPVKRYSSGMRVRLAFAVAAHLDAEILVIDEVLAVGDNEFQRKCLSKMGAVAQAGRTILFVSHNLGAIRRLCTRAITLRSGRCVAMGSAEEVVDDYLRATAPTDDDHAARFLAEAGRDFRLLDAVITDEAGSVRHLFDCDQAVFVRARYSCGHMVQGLFGFAALINDRGEEVMVSDSHDVPPNPLEALSPSEGDLVVIIPPRTVAPGTYRVYMNFSDATGHTIFPAGIVGTCEIQDLRTRRGNRRTGYLSALMTWKVTPKR